MPRQSKANHLVDAESYGTVMLAILIDHYGTEATEWAPETIKMQLEEDFAVEIPEGNFNRLMAAISVLTSDDFYRRLPRFIQICNTLSDADVDPDVFDPADSKECAWGLTEALLLSPPDKQVDDPFTEEIRHYIGAVLDAEGIRNPPDLLKLGIRSQTGEEEEEPDMLSMTDPDMFKFEYDQQFDKSKEIAHMVRTNLDELFAQLKSLELEHGDTNDLAQKISRAAGA